MMKSVALSSCEAEFMAAKHCTCEARWFTQLLSDCGYGDLSPTTFGKLCGKDYEMEMLSRKIDPAEVPYSLRELPPNPPVMIAVDNKCAIATSRNGGFHSRMKHIDTAWMYVQQEVNLGHVRLKYIDTKDNLADLMTKILKRVTFYFLVNKLMHRCENGELQRFDDGAPIDLEARLPVRTKLYVVPAPGLEMGDTLTPLRPMIGDVSRDAAPRLKAPTSVPRALMPEMRSVLAGAVARMTRRAVGRSKRRLFALLVHRLSSVSEGSRRALQILEMMKAIVDSGASSHFVHGAVPLDDVTPGVAVVATATGAPEKVLEKGDCFPLKEVRKVSKFERPLVSVARLVEQFGTVNFDVNGVNVVSKLPRGGQHSTKIGELTKGKLYSFDLRALSKHASFVAQASAA